MTFTASLEDVIAENRNGLMSVHESWSRVPLGWVCSVLNGFPFPSDKFSTESTGVPLIRIRDVMPGKTETYYGGDYPEEFLVQPGELLVGMDGDFNSRIWPGTSGVLNQRVCKLTPDERYYDRCFLAYALPGYLRAINENTPSLTVKHLSSRTVADILLPLPPLPEQHRIVAKIEELFSDLDAGVAALERVRIALKRYRVSVLKAAVEGRLTEAWREENPDVEPADELLGRILYERRERWEREQLAKYETKGKKPLSGWREKYQEPLGPDVDRMPELPDGWCWTTLPQLGFIDRGRSRHRPRNASHLYGGTHPFVQTGDIRQADTYVMDFHQTYSEAGLAQSRLWPKGTLCITIAANIAATAILGFDACFPDSVVGLLPASKDLSVRYVELFLRTAKSGLEALAPATAQKNINLDTLQRLPVVLPPYEEQLEIVSEVDRRLLAEAVVAREVVNSLLRAGRLRQSILTRAFEGRLVPQDPSDEPASLLLQRIKTELQHAALTMVDGGYNGPRPDSERVERARLH